MSVNIAVSSPRAMKMLITITNSQARHPRLRIRVNPARPGIASHQPVKMLYSHRGLRVPKRLRKASVGILPKAAKVVESGRFEGTLKEVLSQRTGLRRRLPIVASGMITSRQGWVETPYLSCPTGLSQLAAGLARIDSAELGPIWFVPGLQYRHPEAYLFR